MNLAQRSKHIQAHNLRCQGLTYRQIGEQMACAASTAAHYVREFEANRAEIIESLAADTLVHTVAALQSPDPDLHAQHINSARELRLLLNSLDQIEDRRQKRERRVAMQEEADALKNIEALGELFEIMQASGIDDLTPYLSDPEAFRTPHFEQHTPELLPPSAPLSSPAALSPPDTLSPPAPLSPRRQAGGDVAERQRGASRSATTSDPTPSPHAPAQTPPDSAHQPPRPVQNRTESNKTEQESSKSPAKQARSRPAARTQQPARSNIPIPSPRRSPNNITEPPFELRNLRALDDDDPRVRKFFGLR